MLHMVLLSHISWMGFNLQGADTPSILLENLQTPQSSQQIFL
jgi:hypothetical protein